MDVERIFPKGLSVVSSYQDAKWVQDALNSYHVSGNRGLGFVIPIGFESYISIRRSNPEDNQNYSTSQEDCAEDLNKILDKFTSPEKSCFVAIWNGFGWSFEEEYGNFYNSKRSASNGFFTSENIFVPYFKTLFREYYLLKCPLFESSKFGRFKWKYFSKVPANIYWPESKEWFVSNEIDYDVTLIGGDEKLILEIEKSGKFITERFDPRKSGSEIYLAPPMVFTDSQTPDKSPIQIFWDAVTKHIPKRRIF